nr:hypothetical protein [uncultured Chitinophaga sp.]
MKNVEDLYPDWHYLPFNLTKEELSNPLEVIRDFCWEFSLPEIRSLLRDWYAASLCNEIADNQGIYITYTAIEKLLDAVYEANKAHSE